MSYLNNFRHKQRRYEVFLIAALLISNALLLATSQIMETQRAGQTRHFELWEPFVWQFSSAALVALLFPLIIRLIDSPLSTWSNIKRTLLIYLLASIAFCCLHVAGMVALRKLSYCALGLNYNFGPLLFELLYEYRKDLFSFIGIILLIHSYRFIISRLQGEADIVNEGENTPPQVSDRLLIKKLGKEFIVKLSDVDWLESSGNYVNLHVGNRIYPTRQTLGHLINTIEGKGFCRTHRSYAVNLDSVESITPLYSGSSDITLKNGKVVKLSRRYHDELKLKLN